MCAHVLPLGTRVVRQYLGVRRHVPTAVWGPTLLTDCVRAWVAPSLGCGPTGRPLSANRIGTRVAWPGTAVATLGCRVEGPGPASTARSPNVPCAACRFCRLCSQQATRALGACGACRRWWARRWRRPAAWRCTTG